AAVDWNITSVEYSHCAVTPVVLHLAEQRPHQRVSPPGPAVENRRPRACAQPIAEPLRPLNVLDPDEHVVALRVPDTGRIELAREPVMPVHEFLHPQREPGLHLHVDQTELPIHEVVVKMQTLASRRVKERLKNS